MEQTSTGTSDNVFDLRMDQQCLAYLLETAKWNKFISIVWFVICGIFTVFAFFAGSFLSAVYSGVPGMENSFAALGAGFGIMMTIIYLVMTAIYLIPNFWRYKFSVQAIRAINGNDQVLLTTSLNNLRKYSKYWGILTIIIIGFYLLIFLFAMIGAAMGSIF